VWRALLLQWPSYGPYLVSFFIIGIIWVNHHRLFRSVARVDATLLFLNLLLLLFVVVVPFPPPSSPSTSGCPSTRTSPQPLQRHHALHGRRLPAVLAVDRRQRPVAACRCPGDHPRDGPRQPGDFFYGGIIGLSFVSAVWTLAVHGALAIYYMLDQVAVGERTAREG
jgi:Endosomal/lysosomal potassium channel TMEM175